MAGVKTIRALDRGLQIVEIVTAGGAMSLHELHLATGLSKATLLRVLGTLARRGWVEPRPDGTTYAISSLPTPNPRLARQQRLSRLAIPLLDALSRKVVWPSDLGIRRGDAMWIVEHSRRNARFIINRNAVGRRPRFLQSALGRAYLAFCPEEERHEILRRLQQSSHPDDRRVNASTWVAKMIGETRQRGYGAREPGYWADTDELGGDVNSIAVPLKNGERMIACLNLLWVADAMSTEEFAKKYLATLKDTAHQLAQRFGAAPET
jgi:IclR family mhp operon transcriptional activator